VHSGRRPPLKPTNRTPPLLEALVKTRKILIRISSIAAAGVIAVGCFLQAF
jgi:hypothetical protein